MAYDNTNSGVLFKNQKKTQENHPNMRGSAEVACPHCQGIGKFWLSAWTKTAGQGKRQGEKFQSIAFTPMDDQPIGETKSHGPAPTADEAFDDDIPF